MTDSAASTPTDADGRTVVFVSFAHDDEDEYVVGPLTRLRKECGDRYEFFLAKDVPSNEWEAKIAETLDRAKALLFFITARSLQSEPTRQEIGLARKKDLTIIPLVLEEGIDEHFDPQLEFRLSGIELLLAHELSQERMVRDIIARLPEASVPTPAAAVAPVGQLEIACEVTRLQRETIEHLLGVLEDCTLRGDTAAFDRAAHLLGMHLWSVLVDNSLGDRLGDDGGPNQVELLFQPESRIDWWPWELAYDWRQGRGVFVALDKTRTFTRRLPHARPVAVQPRAGDRPYKVLFAAPRTTDKELDPAPLSEVFGVHAGREAPPAWSGRSASAPGVDLATRTEHSPTQSDLTFQAVSWAEVRQLLTRGDPVDVFHLVTLARVGTDGSTIELAFADPDDDDAAQWINVNALSSALEGDTESGRNPTSVAVVSFVALGENPWRMAARLGQALAGRSLPAVMTVPYRASSDHSAEFFTTFYTWLFDPADARQLVERVPSVLRRCHRAQQESGTSEVHPFGAPVVYLNTVQVQIDRSNGRTSLKPHVSSPEQATRPSNEGFSS